MNSSVTILKKPALHPSQDYEFLRAKGLEYIQQLGSRLWTDYNIHDPGITILELLSYAITDLGNRCSYDMKDLLAAPWSKANEPLHDPRRQGFYTAREILTVNPWTKSDFRKMLIDIDGVKNAWLQCKECPCDGLFLYANCKTSELQYELTEHPVTIKGFYDVLLEFEDDEGNGNLNSGKIYYDFSFPVNDGPVAGAMIEMRLPSLQALASDHEKYKEFINPESAVKEVAVNFISGNKEDNADIQTDQQLSDGLRRALYATIAVTFWPDKDEPGNETIVSFDDVPFRVWFRSDKERKALKMQELKQAMTDVSSGGIMGKYLEKIHEAGRIIKLAKNRLQECRNLCEDYCSVKPVETEDFAVCADIEAELFADIEEMLAEAYFRIDQYMRPDLKFYSLKQLLDKGKKTDEIFEGPALKNGFIDDDELEETDLRRILYTSDIINLVMDIPGVKAVKGLTIARYNADGNVAQNEPWSIEVTVGRQPALYLEASKIMVYKNGLPFLPDKFELKDTLQVIKGKNLQPKFSVTENDIPVPVGDYYRLNDYYPLQYSLPLTYGVGYDGIPAPFTKEREAQAKQLKAYLLFYEQLLVNYLEQLANAKELFALDHTVDKTSYSRWLNNTDIRDVENLYSGLNTAALQAMMEDEAMMLDRRNRFLDHMLARFAEQFTDYAMMLYSHLGNGTATGDRLIKNKIDFLKDYPFLSSNRARSFNYKNPDAVCSGTNISGLQVKIQRLLGFRKLLNYYELYDITDANGKLVEKRWRIVDALGNKYLASPAGYMEATTLATINKAEQDILELEKFINQDSAYEIEDLSGHWAVHIKNANGDVIAEGYREFASKPEAEAFAETIKKYAARIKDAEKVYVVEHMLLRPRNIFNYFQLYEIKNAQGKFVERRWKLTDRDGKIYLKGNIGYTHTNPAASEMQAKQDTAQVMKHIMLPYRYQVVSVAAKWRLDLLNEMNNIIATGNELFNTRPDAEASRDELIAFIPNMKSERDSLLGICIPGDCSLCGEEDPYSFRLTLVLNGEVGLVNTDIVFRRFAEKTIREEVPAHLGVKICWVSSAQFKLFEEKYCTWLQELAKEEPDATALHQKLEILLAEFKSLKNVYPKATLHDCAEGDDENRVLLGQTVIISDDDIEC